MKNSKLIIGLFLAFSTASFGQNSFTLESAKSYALEHHLSVQNADYDVQSAQKKVTEIRAMGLPQVNITGSFSNFLNLPVQVMDASFFNPMAQPGDLVSFRAGTEYTAQGNMQATQLLFNGSYIIGLKAARELAILQNNASDISKEEVVFNVIQAYELAAVAKANLTFTDSMVIVTQELIDKQQNYLELELMLQEDMDQLNYSLLTAKQAKVSAEVQYQNALALLKFSMGYPMDTDIEITQNTDELMIANALSSGDLKSNLSYQLLERQIGLSKLDVKNNQFANLPTLSAYYQHQYTAYRNEFDFFDSETPYFLQSSWGLQLNVPVFSSGERWAKTQQAKIKLMKDQNALAQMEETLKMQEAQAKNNLTAAQANYDLQRENVELARSIYQNELLKENIGKGNSIIVTQKYNQLIMAQAQYIGSMVDLFQAKLSLDKIYNNVLTNQ